MGSVNPQVKTANMPCPKGAKAGCIANTLRSHSSQNRCVLTPLGPVLGTGVSPVVELRDSGNLCGRAAFVKGATHGS
jgi:hypothetical protein